MKYIITRVVKSIFVSILVVLLTIFPFSASKCADTPYFRDFYAKWIYDGDEDVKIEIVTISRNDPPTGTIVIDDKQVDILVFFYSISETAVVFDLNLVDTTDDKWYLDTASRIFIADVNGYKKSVTFKVIYDYTGRTGKKSLLRKEFALTRTDLE